MTSPSLLAEYDRIYAAASVKHADCPFCGSEPGHATYKCGLYLVGCDSDDCRINPQAGGKTQAEAWAKWDYRS